MRAMVLDKTMQLDGATMPLRLAELPVPEPGKDEVRLHVLVCGVCHTELDEIEGRTPPAGFPVVLGHEVVGVIDKLGQNARRFRLGDRLGVGWIHSSGGGADENISPQFRATGRDVNGGYAEYMTVSDEYAYAIPACFSDIEAAPLLCAGAVGYRALKLAGITDGHRLGLTGFGGSAHLVLQLARYLYPKSPIYVFARDSTARDFARQLGAIWAGNTNDHPPEKLHAIIDTTPAWTPVIEALAHLLPGGRLVINAIRKQDDDKDALLRLSYQEHLWMEREIKTVANVTHFDIQEFLPLAAKASLRCEVTTYPLEEANRALWELKNEPVKGAKVLIVSPDS